MPEITAPGYKIPKSPEDRPIPASNCCGACLYNIPRGSCMVLLPGLILLLCGGLTIVATSPPISTWTLVTSIGIAGVGVVVFVSGKSQLLHQFHEFIGNIYY